MMSMAWVLGTPPIARHVLISGIPVLCRCSEKYSKFSWIWKLFRKKSYHFETVRSTDQSEPILNAVSL